MQTYECPKCNHPLAAGAIRCGNCGTDFTSTYIPTARYTITSSGNYLYPKASLGKRFVGNLLDNLIAVGFALPFIFLTVGFNFMDENSISEILFLLPAMAYLLIRDGFGKGQSWGKRAAGLRVIKMTTNKPADIGLSVARNIINVVLSLIPFVAVVTIIDPILVLATSDGRRLGDFLAGTQVIEAGDYDTIEIETKQPEEY